MYYVYTQVIQAAVKVLVQLCVFDGSSTSPHKPHKPTNPTEAWGSLRRSSLIPLLTPLYHPHAHPALSGLSGGGIGIGDHLNNNHNNELLETLARGIGEVVHLLKTDLDQDSKSSQVILSFFHMLPDCPLLSVRINCAFNFPAMLLWHSPQHLAGPLGNPNSPDNPNCPPCVV